MRVFFNKNIFSLALVSLSICLVVIVSFLFYTKNESSVTIELRSSFDTKIPASWSDLGNVFKPKNSQVCTIKANKELKLTYFAKDYALNKVRINLNLGSTLDSSIIIRRVIIKSGTFEQVYEGESLKTLQFQNVNLKFENNACVLTAQNSDSHLIIHQKTLFSDRIVNVKTQIVKIIFVIILVQCIFWVIFYWLRNKSNAFKKYIVYFLFFAVCSSVIVSVLSRYNTHPDEPAHQGAIDFYSSHYFPKHYADPEVQNQYDWGYNVSRLNATGFSYLIIAKVSQIWNWIIDNPLVSYRLVQCLFLLLLVIASLYYSSALYLVIPLVITPQSWYSFSYINDEAFPIFMCFIVCFEVLSNNSFLNKYIKDGLLWTKILYVLVFSIAFSNVMYAKLNFLVFALFVPILLAYKIMSDSPSRFFFKRITVPRVSIFSVKKYGLALLVAVILAGSYFAVYSYIHSDYNKPKISVEQEKMMQARQANSDNCKKTLFAGFHLSEKGTKYFDMLPNWLETTFQSSFGMYGWMDIVAPAPLYRMFGITFFFFVLFYLAFIFHRASFYDIVMSIICLLFVVFMLFVSSYQFSWKYDYQPQGRYLFPMLPVLGVFFYIGQKYVPKYLTITFVSIMFAFSVYSIWGVLIPYYF